MILGDSMASSNLSDPMTASHPEVGGSKVARIRTLSNTVLHTMLYNTTVVHA